MIMTQLGYRNYWLGATVTRPTDVDITGINSNHISLQSRQRQQSGLEKYMIGHLQGVIEKKYFICIWRLLSTPILCAGDWIWAGSGARPGRYVWYGEEPDGGAGHDCMFVHFNYQYLAFDSLCTTSLYPICQLPPEFL